MRAKVLFVISATFLLALAIVISLILPKEIEAQTGLIGGQIQRVQCCAYTSAGPGGAFIFVGPPVGGPYVYQPPSENREGPPTAGGIFVLGTTGSTITCFDQQGKPLGVGPKVTEGVQETHGTSPGGGGACISGSIPGSLPSSPRPAGQCQTVKSGPCSVENLSKVFGSSSQCSPETMSQICFRESGGRAGLASGVDKLWYEPGNPSFSYGLFQINIVANGISCPDGRFLNCPSAFNPPANPSEVRTLYNSKGVPLGKVRSGSGFGYTIKNQNLFNQCVAAAQDPACNAATAKRLCDAAGTQPWRCLSTGCIGCSVAGQ